MFRSLSPTPQDPTGSPLSMQPLPQFQPNQDAEAEDSDNDEEDEPDDQDGVGGAYHLPSTRCHNFIARGYATLARDLLDDREAPPSAKKLAHTAFAAWLPKCPVLKIYSTVTTVYVPSANVANVSSHRIVSIPSITYTVGMQAKSSGAVSP
ncbi:hypothetical protein GSI_11474 [Ganoderma sinense ZZ0214-1]|uniref:Uncharacterized protein n=1 Tax=Ganoderma sinense ZZ0214-1 TaxID=1077348 RepID=A0A2G8RW68_9APHY|nr:hypothetical protein GSI_11474 [Ganoderma sinense ZZ0214-1]